MGFAYLSLTSAEKVTFYSGAECFEDGSNLIVTADCRSIPSSLQNSRSIYSNFAVILYSDLNCSNETARNPGGECLDLNGIVYSIKLDT
jgi:hypothetical protein